MTPEFEAAVARFDDDLVVAATGSPAVLNTNRLRRRAVTVYRNALDFAAGSPHDPRWRILALIVDEFITSVGSGLHTPHAKAALERLTLLRDVGEQEVTARDGASDLLQPAADVKVTKIHRRKAETLQQVDDDTLRGQVISRYE